MGGATAGQGPGKTLAAKETRNEAAAAFLKSEEHLQEEVERNRHWKSNIGVIQDRVRAEFNAEDDARRINRLETDARLSELELQAAEARDALEAGMDKIEANRQRRQQKRSQEPKTDPKDKAEEAFRRDAEQILNYGAAGKYMGIAEEYRAKVIKERGGEQNLTYEDKERIELVFELARRHQESKG